MPWGAAAAVVVAVASLAACVSLYPGAAVFPLFAVLVWGLFRPSGPGLLGAMKAIAVRWRLWALLAVPLALAAIVTSWGASYDTGATAGPCALASFVWASWSGTIAPGLFGLPPQFLNQRVVGEELAVTVVVVSVVACRGAWRAWTAAAVPTVVVLVAHGAARLANLGPGIESIRSDLLPIELMVAVALPLAFGRSAGVFTTSGTAPRQWWTKWYADHTGPTVLATAAMATAVLVGYAVLVTVGTPDIIEVQQVRLADTYVTTFRASWDAVDRARPGAAVADGILPYPVSISTIPDDMYPYDTAAADLRLFVPAARFSTVAPGPGVYAVSFPSGRLLPPCSVAGPPVDRLPRTVVDARTPTPRSAAASASGPAGSRERDLRRQAGSRSPTRWIWAIGRRSSRSSAPSSSGTGRIASVALAGALGPGQNRLGMALIETPPALVVSLPADSTTCLDGLELELCRYGPTGALTG